VKRGKATRSDRSCRAWLRTRRERNATGQQRDSALGIFNHLLHDNAGRENLPDQPSGFAGNDRSDIEVSSGPRVCVSWSLFFNIAQQFDLTAGPFVRVVV